MKLPPGSLCAQLRAAGSSGGGRSHGPGRFRIDFGDGRGERARLTTKHPNAGSKGVFRFRPRILFCADQNGAGPSIFFCRRTPITRQHWPAKRGGADHCFPDLGMQPGAWCLDIELHICLSRQKTWPVVLAAKKITRIALANPDTHGRVGRQNQTLDSTWVSGKSCKAKRRVWERMWRRPFNSPSSGNAQSPGATSLRGSPPKGTGWLCCGNSHRVAPANLGRPEVHQPPHGAGNETRGSFF